MKWEESRTHSKGGVWRNAGDPALTEVGHQMQVKQGLVTSGLALAYKDLRVISPSSQQVTTKPTENRQLSLDVSEN